MPKTVQIRDIDDEVYRALARRAAEAGVSVPELLRHQAELLAARPTIKEWLERTRRGPSSDITREEIIQALDEMRGPWPDAGG
jgi:plasmid stability protein